MTERKPPGTSFETWIDKQIREAESRGEFTDLPGSGQPLPDLNRPHDELWWIRKKIADEGLSNDVFLPTSLKLRKEIEQLPTILQAVRSEQEVRELVGDLNQRITRYLRIPSGPSLVITPLDLAEVLQKWRLTSTSATQHVVVEAPRPRVRWWQRIGRRRRDQQR